MPDTTRHRLVALPTVFLLLLSLTTLSPLTPVAHAASGSLYINPFQQGPFASGTTVTYQVKVANIDPFNGWEIMAWVNGTSVLDPKSLTIKGNLFQANYSSQVVSELRNCVNAGVGIPQDQPGNMGCTIDDGPGIVHSAAVMFGPPPQTGPSSGLLFNITYTVTGGPGTFLHFIKDQIANGGPTLVTHLTKDGVYGKPKPDFYIPPTLSTITIIAGKNGKVKIPFASLNFTGDVNLTAEVLQPVPTVSFNPSTVKLTDWGNSSSTLTVSTTNTTPAAQYLVFVNATSGSLLHQLILAVFVSAPRPDMVVTSLAVSPTGTVTKGQNVTLTVMVSNNGTIAGDYRLQLLWGNLRIGGVLNGTLTPDQQQPYNIIWNTSRYPTGNFTITATVLTLANSNTRDFPGPTVALTEPPVGIDLFLVSGAVAVAVLVALFIFLRRKKPSKE